MFVFYLRYCYCFYLILQNLENFLRDNHCESILEEEQRNGLLSLDSQDILLDCIRDFVQNEFSLNATSDQLEEGCVATIKLFPSLESKTDQKIVSLSINLVQCFDVHFLISFCFFFFSLNRIFCMTNLNEVVYCMKRFDILNEKTNQKPKNKQKKLQRKSYRKMKLMVWFCFSNHVCYPEINLSLPKN